MLPKTIPPPWIHSIPGSVASASTGRYTRTGTSPSGPGAVRSSRVTRSFGGMSAVASAKSAAAVVRIVVSVSPLRSVLAKPSAW